MSRHRTNLKGEKLCHDKEIYVATFFLSNKELNVVTTKFLCRNTRHLCCDNYKTTSAELCRDIFKVCRDIIQEEGTKLCRDRNLQATTKMTAMSRQSNLLSQIFWDP